MQYATITITDLSLRTIIGLNEWEREKKQDIILNIDLRFDATAAAASDDVKDTVDYKALKQKLITFIEASDFLLLEKLNSRVLDLIMEDPKVLSARVRIDKPHALRFAKSVALIMERTREERA